ncbi:MAG: SDR family oxidoreductase [Anaerolineaceae bacterium]|nr:SDR family oxidoreductase [Anaerolineaceae bacterium]
MTRFAVTGASGLLGLNLSLQITGNDEVLGIANTSPLEGLPYEIQVMDLVSDNFEKDVLETYKPDVVIHCAAIANLEECEKNPELAYQTNAIVPGEIAYQCRKRDVKFVHISTDAVFDGKIGNYSEKDRTNPLSVYAKTKRAGEENVQIQNSDAIIARVNFFRWSLSGTRSLGEFFFNNLTAGNPINGFIDVHFCPLYVLQLSELLFEMVRADLSGIYHLVSSDHMTKYEFGCAIANQFGLDQSLINPISVTKSNLQAERSLNLTLSTNKLSTDLNRSIPTTLDGIKQFYEDYQSGYAQKIRNYLIEN